MNISVKTIIMDIREAFRYLLALFLCVSGCFAGAVRYGLDATSSFSYAMAMGILMVIITIVLLRKDKAKEKKKAARYMEYLRKKQADIKHSHHDVNDAINAIDKIDISHISNDDYSDNEKA